MKKKIVAKNEDAPEKKSESVIENYSTDVEKNDDVRISGNSHLRQKRFIQIQ